MKKAKSGHKGTTRLSEDVRRIVLDALLGGENQETAAQRAGISSRTVRRWLADPAFAVELETARSAAFTEALGGLKGGAAIAVKTLLQNLNVKNAAERRQAARTILEFAFKGVETLDFEARLAHIEKLLEEGAGIGLARMGRVS